MEIVIQITGSRYNSNTDAFSSSFTKLINNDNSLKAIIEENPKEIAILIKNEFTDGIEYIISNHLSIDTNFALKLNLLDSLDCACLETKTTLGDVLKKIMINNFQLILTRKHWCDIDKLILFFDAVEFGCIDDFIDNTMQKNKSQKIF